MTQSTYAWMGSPLHLVLDDDLAAAYNRAQDAWFAAQRNHKIVYGREWKPEEPIRISWTREESEAWDKVAQVINLLAEINRGGLAIMPEDITSDYLVKVE
ncbi:MAG: hypothetical protein ACJ74Y_14265 [Bryobacteraceae bacterium]|jgi:hypothetical protein